MTFSNFLQNVNDALRGTDDDAPTVGTTEANYWGRVLNRKKNELYQDVSQQWNETFQIMSLGTVTVASAPVYSLDTSFLSPSDTAYIITTASQRVDYQIVPAQERPYTTSSNRVAFIASDNPPKLYFSNAIATGENIVSGTLYLPGFYMPADVDTSSGGSYIPLPDPYWGVMAVAAEIAGNDLTYEDKEPNLTAKANNLYSLMVKKNRKGTYNNPRTSSYNVTRITGPSRR